MASKGTHEKQRNAPDAADKHEVEVGNNTLPAENINDEVLPSIESIQRRDAKTSPFDQTKPGTDHENAEIASSEHSAKKSRKRVNPYTDSVDEKDLCDPNFWRDDSNFLTPTAEDEEAFERELDEFQAELDRNIANHRQTRNELDQSRRNPDMRKADDLADQIDVALAKDNHKKWGFVLYRCTYESEEEWQEALSSIQFHLKRTLTAYNGLELLDSHELTVMDNRAEFDGAQSPQLRKHFQNWTASAVEREQGTIPQTRLSSSQRYRFFLRIDKQNLKSIINVIRSGDGEFVDVDRNKPPGHMDLVIAEHNSETSLNDPSDGEVELLDGGKDYDVGWARFNYKRYLDIYTLMRPDWNWMEFYTRPPMVL